MRGLLVDFGGVLTTNVFDSFRAFCVDEGLDPDAIKQLFREHPEALRLVRALETLR
jgi:putative hydrolase of the HAD superfamily